MNRRPWWETSAEAEMRKRKKKGEGSFGMGLFIGFLAKVVADIAFEAGKETVRKSF